MAELNQRAQDCGYFDFLDNALTYPPTGPLPSAPNSSLPGCAVWDDAVVAATYVNPCFNFYHITDFCPYLNDELGMCFSSCPPSPSSMSLIDEFPIG